MNILTFDIEEWFLGRDATRIALYDWEFLEPRVVASTETILKILDDHHQKASFFVLGWVAKKYPSLIEKIHSKGHHIGYHSFEHLVPLKQNPKDFEADLKKGLKLLQSICGENITSYRAPMFSFRNSVSSYLDILIDNGIETSSSFFAGIKTDVGYIPPHPFILETSKGKLLEFPLVRTNLFFFKLTYSGSGYMRILPYSVSKFFFESNLYNVAYFHPRDFDSNVPSHPNLGRIRNIFNSLGNKTTNSKLRHLLSDFAFISLNEAAIRWIESSKKIT